MRGLFLLIFLVSASAADVAPYPLWDGRESIAEYAKTVNLPPTKSVDLGSGVKMEFVLIPAGQLSVGASEPVKPVYTIFGSQMLMLYGAFAVLILVMYQLVGSSHGIKFTFSLRWLLLFTAASGTIIGGAFRLHYATIDAARYEAEKLRYEQLADESHAHQLSVSRPFYLAKYPVTQTQYETLIGQRPSHFKGPQLPVELVSWSDAQLSCEMLNIRSKQAGFKFRLPTETQWEYACRAGASTIFFCSDNPNDLTTAAWFHTNSGSTTHPVGTKEPNNFGLYDMLGNVAQWCDLHLRGGSLGHDTCSSRGGSWQSEAADCRISTRERNSLYFRSDRIGFRVALVILGND